MAESSSFAVKGAVHSSGSLGILPGVKPDLAMRLKIIAPEFDYYAEVGSADSWEPDSTNRCIVNCHCLNSRGAR